MSGAVVFGPRRASMPGRIGLALLIAIGIDLFFNAGLFAPLFDQTREPALLPDEVLFRRIPVAYLALLTVITLLAWVLDRTGRTGRAAIATGAIGGLGLGIAGLGALWTAIDITGPFVAAGIGVLVLQGGASGAVLGSRLPGRRLTLRVSIATVVLVVLGQVVANLAT